ncbi:hypothetical protein FGG08_003307 [Glutinoglossum americanum]|uniref:SGS-domain-containing protein n=1 Tax=Glutinoglossum americanum TaxID=1670608 RepID=A0A9P8L4V6_9PEZI|nr:hypothetical protein FGG08_003307 [Glutinoglossum americanum]
MATQALEAFNAGNYALAITLYTTQLSQYPSTLDYYIKRSTAYQRTADYASALSDAEVAAALAHKRGRRDVLATAQLRRGIALYMLGRYGDAKICFEAVKRLNDKERGLDIWMGKCEKGLRELPADDEKGLGNVKEIPDVEVPKPGTSHDKGKENVKPDDAGKKGQSSAPTQASSAAEAQTPANKIRHDWYQTRTDVVFTLLAKGVPKDEASIDIEEQSFSISFPLASGATYDFSIDPLYGPINPSTSISNIYSAKIEITLKKSTPGQNWKALEGTALVKGKGKAIDAPAGPPEYVAASATSPATTSPTTAAEHPPSYPTSSKRGPKDWDKLAADLTKKKPSSKSNPKPTNAQLPSAPEGQEEELAYDDDDDDDEEGDPVNSFFKKLYKDADPDTRRAMIKSYQESNGTALSTNWGEVGKGKVEISPPEGMVAKKWGE